MQASAFTMYGCNNTVRANEIERWCTTLVLTVVLVVLVPPETCR
jgi:hypothetical protein